MGIFMTACSDDDDYAINTTPLLGENSVVTGSADVTATNATLHGTVSGLDGQASSAYTTGFKYGSSADNLSENVTASGGTTFSASVAGSANETIYYQAYVTLQGKVTYTGSVSSCVLTDAKAITGEASDLTANTATIAGTTSLAPTDAEAGIVLSSIGGSTEDDDVELVRAGVKLPASALAEAYSVSALGLIPGTTYYYCAYLDLGSGVVYGDVKQFTTPSTVDFDVDEDMVDLGLSTKWAKYNIGAQSETDLGGLYGFGDVAGYKTSVDASYYGSADVYKSALDVANVALDGKATIPTIDEFEELFRCCTTEWYDDYEGSGVAGYKFTGPNGNSIFMPAAGSRTQNTTTGKGTEGRYLSGSINNFTDSQYAMSYIFTSSANARTTTPVYQALSVRPVSVAKNVAFDKSLLYNTWEIDLTEDGEYQTFAGPTYFYGTDDSWRTVTNNEPIVGDVWSWEADFASNSWAVGGSAANCQGSITFNEDGTVKVVHKTAEGTESIEEGTYTVDEVNKTITLTGAKVLAPTNYTESYVNSLTTDIKILSLTEKSLQLAVVRTESPCLLSINMVPQLEKYGYTAKLTCYGGDGNQSDAWNSATVTVAGGQTGTYTVTFNTTEPRSNGMVYVLDIVGFATAYPNAFVKIDAIKADGNDVPFDANKFYYGNIEGGGNYRVEMANIWGCGHNDGWNGLADTPFHKGGGETTNETALAFNSTFEVTFTIVSLDASLEFTAKQTAVGLDAGWNMPGNWDKENPAAIKVVKDNFQYKLASTDNISLSLDAATDCSGAGPSNGAVNLVDIVGIRSYFSGFSADLISVNNDGVNVPFTASKLITGDIEGNGNYRIELHNIWGAGTASDPAFGGSTSVEGNNCVTSLGFTNSSVYTIGNFSTNLFALPW